MDEEPPRKVWILYIIVSLQLINICNLRDLCCWEETYHKFPAFVIAFFMVLAVELQWVH